MKNKESRLPVTRRLTAAEIAAQSFASKRDARPRLGTGKNAAEYFGLYQHELINDRLKELLADIEAKTAPYEISQIHQAEKNQEGPFLEKNLDKTARNFKISKKTVVKKNSGASVKPTYRRNTDEVEGLSSTRVEKEMIMSLLRKKPLNEEVEKPLQEYKAELERKNKALARLKIKRAKARAQVTKNGILDLSIEPPKDSETQDNFQNQTIDSPARFHPKPQEEVPEVDSPLVKSKREKPGEEQKYFSSRTKFDNSKRQISAHSYEDIEDPQE